MKAAVGIFFFILALYPITSFTQSLPRDLRPPIDPEKILGPWLNLRAGGQALGPAQTAQKQNPDGTTAPWYGGLLNGTQLPASGEAFVRLNSPDVSWGTGMMISLIDQASSYYAKNYSPGLKIYVGAIAQQNGGPYGPHKSHQNGLDADILFMGQTRYGTVLDDQGNVSEKFDPQKNWDFWRLLTYQRILVKGQPTSVVHMIFVAPVIKNFMCAWAKAHGKYTDPRDLEVLRRLRRTEGHDTHFHVRLKCSPYYKDCYQQGEIAAGPGCDA